LNSQATLGTKMKINNKLALDELADEHLGVNFEETEDESVLKARAALALFRIVEDVWE
jgi:hypothetical protein